jgi:hypothetical protein
MLSPALVNQPTEPQLALRGEVAGDVQNQLREVNGQPVGVRLLLW